MVMCDWYVYCVEQYFFKVIVVVEDDMYGIMCWQCIGWQVVL